MTEFRYRCEDCGVTCMTDTRALSHVGNTDHRLAKAPRPDPWAGERANGRTELECQVCRRIFPTMIQLNQHAIRHEMEEPLIIARHLVTKPKLP